MDLSYVEELNITDLSFSPPSALSVYAISRQHLPLYHRYLYVYEVPVSLLYLYTAVFILAFITNGPMAHLSSVMWAILKILWVMLNFCDLLALQYYFYLPILN